MKIGIIGAGAIGSTQAKKWVNAGHSVKIANSKGPETLTQVAKDTGATPVTSKDAVKDVQIVVVSVPFKAVPSLKDILAQAPTNVIVIDTNNYYPGIRDGSLKLLKTAL